MQTPTTIITASTLNKYLKQSENGAFTLDLSKEKKVKLSHVDLDNVTDIKYPHESIYFSSVSNLNLQTLNLSKLKSAHFENTTPWNASTILLPTDNMQMFGVSSLPSELDLSKTKKSEFIQVYFTNVKSIKWPDPKQNKQNDGSIEFYECSGMRSEILSGYKKYKMLQASRALSRTEEASIEKSVNTNFHNTINSIINSAEHK